MAEQTNKADRVKLNRELAQMLKGGVIMDVTTPEQARIAEEAGACAVMALERIPADSREGLLGVLAGDPRPRYQQDPDRVYGFLFAGQEVRFTVDGDRLQVVDIK